MSLADLLIIDAQKIDELLDYPALMDALHAAHLEEEGLVERGMVTQERPNDLPPNQFLYLPSWQGSELGLKAVTVFPSNQPPLASVHALYLLFDATDGRPIAILDGTALTPWKTAADSGLGSRLLAREDCQSLLMVGAGVMAPHLIRAHLAARPGLTQVTVWNRSPDRAETLAANLAPELAARGAEVSATRDIETAARRADLISCATAANDPVIKGAWLKPGCHLDLVGSFTEDMRECDDDGVRRAQVFVDHKKFTPYEIGDLSQPLKSGVLAPGDLLGDLFDLCQGKCGGRASADAITLFKNGGGGHLDLMTAKYIVKKTLAES